MLIISEIKIKMKLPKILSKPYKDPPAKKSKISGNLLETPIKEIHKINSFQLNSNYK
jgi:hypothetical protein